MKKDPGIPNLFPYKDKILQNIEEKKRVKEEELLRKREEAKQRNATVVVSDATAEAVTEDNDEEILYDEDMDEDDPPDAENPMSALLASARARAAAYEEASQDEDDSDEDEQDAGGVTVEDTETFATPSGSFNSDSSRRAFDKIFKSVLERADVIFYVLDARDPNATRSREIERQVRAADKGDKRLILILNKIDLVPPPVLKTWLTYLRRSFPTLPLRASTPAPNAKTFDHKALTVKATSETLLRALKVYAQGTHRKGTTTVGVIGYPNVGKSSVINALTSRLGRSASHSTACPTGAEAGITTSLREVKLDNRLKLLDSPGIVFPNSDALTSSSKRMSPAQLTLLSALPPKAISDPVPAINLLLSRLSSSPARFSSLLSTYDIPPLVAAANGDMTTDFLVQVARKRGRLGKWGVPNLDSAAMAVLSDWRDGRIHGWVEAPVEKQEAKNEIVDGWAEEFKLEGLWGDEAVEEAATNDDEMKE